MIDDRGHRAVPWEGSLQDRSLQGSNHASLPWLGAGPRMVSQRPRAVSPGAGNCAVMSSIQGSSATECGIKPTFGPRLCRLCLLLSLWSGEIPIIMIRTGISRRVAPDHPWVGYSMCTPGSNPIQVNVILSCEKGRKVTHAVLARPVAGSPGWQLIRTGSSG